MVLNTAYTGEGAEIGDITPGGPAEKAGLRVGDVIIGFNDRQVVDSTELVVAIRSYAPGEKIEISITRNGQNSTIPLTLGSSTAIG